MSDFDDDNQVLTPEQKKKAIKDFCAEMSASMTRVKGETTFRREAVKRAAEKTEVDKKILRKMAKVYHDSRFLTLKEENEEFETVYTEVFGNAAI